MLARTMKSIVIQPDGSQREITPLNGTDFQLDELKEFIGAGLIEVLTLTDSAGAQSIMVLDEEGKLKDLPLNFQATKTALVCGAIPLDDYLVGPVLWCDRNLMQ